MNIDAKEKPYKKGCGSDRGTPIGHKKTMNGKPTFLNGNGCVYHSDCFTCPFKDCILPM
jgi:hypothetical protein